jgi:hypothetical protein
MYRLLLLLLVTTAGAQEPWPDLHGAMLGQTPPGKTPEVFAPDLISTVGVRELNAVFSPDMSIFMFSRQQQDVYKMFYTYRDASGRWSAPQLAGPSRTFPGHADVDMAFAPGGQRLYFISKRPLPGYAIDTYNIWFSDRSAEGLHPPVALGPHINGPGHEYYPMVVGDGSLYFSAARHDSLGAFDSYRAQFRDGRFDPPVNLGAAINSEFHEGDIFVDAAETYLIHVSRGRPDDLGNGDLYISYRQPDGSWGQDLHMGPLINSPEIDYCPMVTPDGKVFFFSRGDDIYWVDADILEQFRP